MVAIIDPNNVPSQRVAEKLGFQLEREVIKSGKMELIFADRHRQQLGELGN
ncbi:MAG: GNAT family N-acetyltransferase [Candidatus Dormibacteraceae bacterium]